MLSWSKVIGGKKFTNKSADVYARGEMNFGSDTVLSEIPNFMDFDLSSANTTDELGSIFVPNDIIGRPTNGFNCLQTGNDISKATADRVSRTKAKNYYNFKSEFETRRDKMLDQNFGCQNYPMSQPLLDLNPLGTNTTNKKTSPIGSIKIGTRTPEPTPLTRPTELTEKNGKVHVPGEPDPDLSLSY